MVCWPLRSRFAMRALAAAKQLLEVRPHLVLGDRDGVRMPSDFRCLAAPSDVGKVGGVCARQTLAPQVTSCLAD